MFDFGYANENQKLAISTTDGPVLITAGPGTGKTQTLVQRAIYLIQEKQVNPEQIMMATFTEKAAKELITRITNELADRNIVVNINDMYIGTFHSICLRIIKEHLEFTRLKKNYRTLDQFDQNYTVFQNIWRFRKIDGILDVFPRGAWRMSEKICSYSSNLIEELVDPQLLKNDTNPTIRTIGEVLELYLKVLDEHNLIDFSSIQLEAYKMLKNNPSILEELQNKIKYIMVDEYQDTNYIQEQIVFLLAGKNQNICVVGDDDQGLYRFRGATIRNILEFPSKFPEGMCKVIPLVINYRSNSDIVDFYNKWMTKTSGRDFKFSWDKYRFNKKIIAYNQSTLKSPGVVRISGENDEDEWHENALKFINDLMESGKITNFNQIAFLFKSLKNKSAIGLANYLENNGINVYSPRSDMFFDREEIMLSLGILMLLFPRYVIGLEKKEYKFLQTKHYKYFYDCIVLANSFLEKKENKEFRNWISNHGKIHANLEKNTDYGYSGLLYKIFEFEPFRSLLDTDVDSGVTDVRPLRNLAKLSQIIGKYEYLHKITVLTKKSVIDNTEKFFNLYLKLLIDGGISEYEDDSEYAPSGCVSFLTIHQSKGMEFPIVIVDSLSSSPRNDNDELMIEIEEKYFKRKAYEPYDQIKYFDFWRVYYTAFSRAQNLLVLTANRTNRSPSKYFEDSYNELIEYDNPAFDINEFTFAEVKDVNLKDTFSFTSHITVYERCSLQYKFYKELGFMPVRAGSMVFGILVHETIEDIHKAAIKNELDKITKDNIESWFNSNYEAISKSEHSYLGEMQLQAALNQVLRYVERQNDDWHLIQQAEVDVSLVEPDYIIGGKIDLIKGENDTVEIVDFKSEKKPDMFKSSELLEQYRRQLHLYAYLVEERTGHKVSKMHLYYTGEDSGVPTISYNYTKTAIDGTISSFDDTVRKIMKKDFSRSASDTKICKECDFRNYCLNK